MARSGKKRSRAASEPEATDTAETPSSSLVKRFKGDMSPKDKDAQWVEDHEYGELNDVQILGEFFCFSISNTILICCRETIGGVESPMLCPLQSPRDL